MLLCKIITGLVEFYTDIKLYSAVWQPVFCILQYESSLGAVIIGVFSHKKHKTPTTLEIMV